MTFGPFDHLVYAAPDLDDGVERIAALLGVRPVAGGRHAAWGTRNALISLGARTYLEVIAPDPERADPAPPSLFGIDRLAAPALVTWAARVDEIEQKVDGALRRGLGPLLVLEGSRRTPGGDMLSWKLTDPEDMRCHGVVPFLIDWLDSPHPAERAPDGCELVGLRAEHPDPGCALPLLAALELTLPVSEGAVPALIATIRSPNGVVELH
jgi:hypothetical protein